MHFFKTALSLACLAGSTLAQLHLTSVISPPAGTTLTAGSEFTVQVGVANYIQNYDVVAIAVGLAPCSSSGCVPGSELMGSILFQGPWQPEGEGGPNFVNYDNYTVTVPQGFPAGPASVNVVNFFMVGASFEPTLDYASVNVTVISC